MVNTKLQKYMDLKKSVKEAERKANQAEGALQQVTKQLKKEFGCTSLEAAERKLKLLEKQKQKADIEFENDVAEFEEDWGKDSEL